MSDERSGDVAPDGGTTLPEELPQRLQESLLLIAGAVGVGLLTGLVGVGFLYALQQGNAWRIDFVQVLKIWSPKAGFALFAGSVARCAGGWAWWVQRFAPNAVGSGVPYV